MDLNLPGISAANEKHIRQIAPELCTQLQTQHQRGWQVEERPNNRGSHIAGRRIVIDPRASFTETNTEKRGPHSYLRVLAHQVGCGLDLHRSPISLATRDEYVQGSLRREAAGVWNELQLRDSILERTGGRIDIWSGAEDEYKALASIRERVVNAAEAKQKIAARLGEMRAANGKTYSSIYARQYDLFQISDKTSEDAIKYVQACFNETGVALPSNQIKASCRRPDGAYYWMTQEGLTATLNDFKLSFQDKGFADDEIAGAVMTALPASSIGSAELQTRDMLRSIPLVPRNLVLGFLTAYRKVISPMYGHVCAYYPSCSAYAVGAVQQHGAVRGTLLSAWRILRCNPWSHGGVDDVRPHEHFRYDLTAHGFVVPARKD